MMGCLSLPLGIIICAGMAAIIGAIVRAVTGIEMMFWITSVPLFIFGLPGILISELFSGIGDAIEDAQDRADLRQMDADFAADERMDRYLDKLDELKNTKHSKSDIYIDNRQVHFHNHEKKSNKSRDKNGRFISSKKKKK